MHKAQPTLDLGCHIRSEGARLCRTILNTDASRGFDNREADGFKTISVPDIVQQEVTGISPKVLAKELKDLEENDFITRRVYPTTPVSIIYEATAYSKTLKNVLGELGAWGQQHREKIKQSMRNQS